MALLTDLILQFNLIFSAYQKATAAKDITVHTATTIDIF